MLGLQWPHQSSRWLPGGGVQRVTWTQSDSEQLRVTTPEHPGSYPEEEEEWGGSLGLRVTAQGYGRLAGGGGTQ